MSNFRIHRLRERHRHLSLPLIHGRLKARSDEFLIRSLNRQRLQPQDDLNIAGLGPISVEASFGER